MAKNQKDKIFITGANGFVGQFLVRLFSEAEDYDLLLNRRNRENQFLLENHICTNVNFSDENSIRAFFEEYQPDHIIHLAAMAKIKDGEQDPNKAFKTNYLGTKILIDQAIKHQTKSFVFVSSELVRNYQSVVGITKFLSESFIKTCDQSKTRLITVRLPNISWTPGSVHLIFEQLINENKAITITHPDMSRRFISGVEAAEYIKFAWEKGKDRNLFVINKQPEKITDLARQMTKESGVDLTISIIGMRPEEKLVEETYTDIEVKNTGFKDLALLLPVKEPIDAINRAVKMLNEKQGFSMNTEAMTI